MNHQLQSTMGIFQYTYSFVLFHGIQNLAMILNSQIFWIILQFLFLWLDYIRSQGNFIVNDIVLNCGGRLITIVRVIQLLHQVLRKIQERNRRRRIHINPHKLIQLLHGYRFVKFAYLTHISSEFTLCCPSESWCTFGNSHWFNILLYHTI